MPDPQIPAFDDLRILVVEDDLILTHELDLQLQEVGANVIGPDSQCSKGAGASRCGSDA